MSLALKDLKNIAVLLRRLTNINGEEVETVAVLMVKINQEIQNLQPKSSQVPPLPEAEEERKPEKEPKKK